jgi:DNA-nicking Smr family endonuclease
MDMCERNSDDEPFPDSLDFPIDGILDLHTFPPAEVAQLIPDYLEECRRHGILEVRIIHGKGTGRLRDLVRRILSNHPAVLSFHTPSDASGWGATIVQLQSGG